MALKRKKSSTQNTTPSFWEKIKNNKETIRFIVGLTLTVFALYLLLACCSFFFTGAADQSILHHHEDNELYKTDNQIKNYAGAQGARLASLLINDCFGVATFFLILLLGVIGVKLMRAFSFRIWRWFICCSVLTVWFSIALSFTVGTLFEDTFFYVGGLHGYNANLWLSSQIGVTGLALLLFTVALLFSIYISHKVIDYIRLVLRIPFSLKHRVKLQEQEQKITPDDPSQFTDNEPVELRFDIEDSNKNEVIQNQETETTTNAEEKAMPTNDGNKEKGDATPLEPSFIIEQTVSADEGQNVQELPPYNPRLDLENYQFPTLSLLNQQTASAPSIDMDEQNANKNQIIKVLSTFGISISSIKASVGPTITLYEITPAEGVRISKIKNLQDDIALNLKAKGIRIIAPMPGKGTIGIEVPNTKPSIVSMHSVLNSRAFQETKMELPIAIGKTISNEVYMFDLAKAPHLLVAGATGMGKSVGLNAIVTSLLYKKHPAEMKMVIVDPKMVEFSIYAPIQNHFLSKIPEGDKCIITDTDKVIDTLNSLCVEMDARYELLMKANCRNVKEYNTKFIDRRLNPEKGHRFMPYIVVIIDEYGDLIMTAGKEIEVPICRIAQKARAIGIHMIIATQRPTANIITGTIKANFPSRIAFKVSDALNSRTILDTQGADQLIGKGDMLYLEGNTPVRVQCAFIDTPEVENVVDYISHQQAYPIPYILPDPPREEGDGSAAADVDLNKLDPMFDEAAELIVASQQGSTSLIQRKFSIGYNRAGRIMDQLEAAGIVGPTQGSKPRDVLCMDLNDLEMRLSSLKQR